MLRRILKSHDEPPSKGPQSFDPEAEYVKHTRVGVWDLYEDKRSKAEKSPSSSVLEKLDETLTALPFVVRTFKTLAILCFDKLIIYLVASLVQSLLPAISLYYSGQLLQIVQESIDSRSVDRTVLFSVLGCNMACAVLRRLTSLGTDMASRNISQRMRSHFAEHILRAHARLDVPTFEDPSVQGQLQIATTRATSTAWAGIQAIIGTISTIIQLLSQFSVLLRVLKGQQDGLLLALLSFAEPVFMWIGRPDSWHAGVWAATCRDDNYVRMQGLKHLVSDKQYRKELTAGNLQDHIISEFQQAQKGVGHRNDVDLMEALRIVYQEQSAFSFSSFLRNPLHELPQVVFTLRAVQSPKSIPVSLASLTLIRQTVVSFSGPLISLLNQTSSMSETFASIRKLYEMVNIENQIIDGTEPYPENKQSVKTGIAIEFKNVSFKYPNSERYAIRDVSFRIGPGQLCVLVGFNGSGKSTVLKLLARLYDPTEGVILVDGRDIKALKLSDLRRCISVLFQDYTHFPLSVKENIGLGNPEHAKDEDMIRQAAELGGATEIIETLSEGFETFLSRPVSDYYSGLPEGTQSVFGRQIDYSRVRRRIGRTQNVELSGGQMQRLAVSRTFMRSLGSDSDVGLLLFDEPSASLDPEAEHDLFERLRRLRGNKTMVFSSHRFGQLTRHADKILYMAKSTVLELGTHDDLLKLGGGYSKMYNIQAAQFK